MTNDRIHFKDIPKTSAFFLDYLHNHKDKDSSPQLIETVLEKPFDKQHVK
jgi:hypothetical protein